MKENTLEASFTQIMAESGFTPRQAQLEAHVAFQERTGHHALQAPTGTGKSAINIGYSIAYAAEVNDPRDPDKKFRTCITAPTRLLADQYAMKEVNKFREAAHNRGVEIVVLKGSKNYVCLNRLESALQGLSKATKESFAEKNIKRDRHDQLMAGIAALSKFREDSLDYLVWIDTQFTQRFDDFVKSLGLGSKTTKEIINGARCETNSCSKGSDCYPDDEDRQILSLCPYRTMKRKALTADIVVTTSTMALMSTPGSSRQSGLGQFHRFIVDEAHKLIGEIEGFQSISLNYAEPISDDFDNPIIDQFLQEAHELEPDEGRYSRPLMNYHSFVAFRDLLFSESLTIPTGDNGQPEGEVLTAKAPKITLDDLSRLEDCLEAFISKIDRKKSHSERKLWSLEKKLKDFPDEPGSLHPAQSKELEKVNSSIASEKEVLKQLSEDLKLLKRFHDALYGDEDGSSTVSQFITSAFRHSEKVRNRQISNKGTFIIFNSDQHRPEYSTRNIFLASSFQRFFSPYNTIFTSATLGVEDDQSLVHKILGFPAEAVRVTELDNGYDYASRQKILLTDSSSIAQQIRLDPKPGSPKLTPGEYQFMKLLQHRDGGAMVFANSHDHKVRLIGGELPEKPYRKAQFISGRLEEAREYFGQEHRPLFMQGPSGTSSEDNDRTFTAFKDTKCGIIAGLDSFREGVDAPGEALETIYIAKQPWVHKNVEVSKAVLRNYIFAGMDFRHDYYLPIITLNVQQMIGRGMRSETDHCVILINVCKAGLAKQIQVKDSTKEIGNSKSPVDEMAFIDYAGGTFTETQVDRWTHLRLGLEGHFTYDKGDHVNEKSYLAEEVARDWDYIIHKAASAFGSPVLQAKDYLNTLASPSLV